MPSKSRFKNAPLTATPSLERLLSTLGSRLRSLVILRAAGLAIASFVALWAWAFFADFVLGVPSGVRAMHGALLVIVPVAVLVRAGFRHLGSLPDRRQMAILLEAQQGDEDLFTSAADFQLNQVQENEDSSSLIQRVYERAEAAAAKLAKSGQAAKLGVLDPTSMQQAAGVALLGALALGGAFALWPTHQNVFSGRLFGAGQPWPQLTFLAIEIPLESGITIIEEHGAVRIDVRIARGQDLPILVLSQGLTPSAVELIFDDDSRRVLASATTTKATQTIRETARFATTLRSISRDLSFVVEGGDDERRETRVHVRALSPPDLSELQARIIPPAYTGLPEQILINSDMAVLAGSRIEFTATTAPTDATGVVRLLPEDRTVELTQTPAGLSFGITPERSQRLRFELLDKQGLANPDPGLWSIKVNDDHAPRVSVRSPEGLNLETTIDGVLPLWVAIEDDFAVSSAHLIGATGDAPLPLELRSVDGGAESVFAFASIDLERLVETPEVGQTIWVQVEAQDNREPVASTGLSSKISLRVLTREDYMRRVQDRLAAVRRRTSELFDLQREKQTRLQELTDAQAIDGALDQGGLRDLASVLSGQRRIEADSLSILRELSGLCGDVLHARVDAEASGQLEYLDRLLAGRIHADFAPETWGQLIERHRSGQLGKAGFAGNLIELTGAGYRVAVESAPAALAGLKLAEQDGQAMDEALDLASRNLSNIEALLGQLAEWDNFQSVLSLTREVLKRQKAVLNRTKQLGSQ